VDDFRLESVDGAPGNPAPMEEVIDLGTGHTGQMGESPMRGYWDVTLGCVTRGCGSGCRLRKARYARRGAVSKSRMIETVMSGPGSRRGDSPGYPENTPGIAGRIRRIRHSGIRCAFAKPVVMSNN
jgi:hypothetical protein